MRRFGVILGLVFGMILACGETMGPTTPDIDPITPVTPVINTPETPEIALKGCQVLEVRQRRWKNKNTLILEVWPVEGVSELVVKFLIGSNLIYKEYVVPNKKMEIELPLECRDREYEVKVWVEGKLGGKLYQCDGAVFFTWKCKPKKPECSNPTYGGFFSKKIWHGDKFDIYAGYDKLLGKGKFKLTLRRHRCLSQIIMREGLACHPLDWEDSKSLDCFTQGALQLVAKNQGPEYSKWCYTSRLYLDGDLVDTRRIQ